MKESFFAEGVDHSRDYAYPQQNPHYLGQRFDQQLAEGPSQSRGCRDILCIVLFAAMLGAVGVVGFLGFRSGDPKLLASPFDSFGKQCGVSPGYSDFPYGYYKQGDITTFGCVQWCPTNSSSNPMCILNGIVNTCANLGLGVYPTTQVVTMCFPSTGFPNQVIDLGLDFFQKGLHDVQHSWMVSAGILLTAFLLSLLIMCFVRTCGGCLIIGMIILKIGAFVTLGAVAFAASIDQISLPITNTTQLRIIAFVSWGLAILFFIITVCKFRQIRIAVGILRVAATFTRDELQSLIVPFLMFFMVGSCFIIWAIVSLYLVSSGQISSCGNSPYACVRWNQDMQRGMIIATLGLFWACEAVICSSQFIIASASSHWYFAHLDPNNPKRGFVCISICRALTLQLGSILFAAFVLTLVRILQFTMWIFSVTAKKRTLSMSPAANCCHDCCLRWARCCIECFQRFVRFISKNGLILAAMTGEGFCKGCHQAFYLVLRSTVQCAVTHGLGHLVMWVCKLAVTALCALFAYLLLAFVPQISSQLYSPVLPTIFCAGIGLVVAHFFTDLFGIAADTILMAYCLEKEFKPHTPSCPPSLRTHLPR